MKPPARVIGFTIPRHSFATSMVRRGASLAQIGNLPRHRSRASTMIYAKMDVEDLRAVGQEWPTDGDTP
ncbi:hypothetical protein LJ725_13940 [Reyranella aquatilis]|uniref:Tyr recombinase domain-containing protein n=1 Tax=Reyranella aquatilis TaxID=2035356 RepID=A0ABS8KVG5_9HYPH|nr:hypothetical protein [Reyranella aquatilis]MCC8430076.1 hypothetical protein [Reyranella aquatilis]